MYGTVPNITQSRRPIGVPSRVSLVTARTTRLRDLYVGSTLLSISYGSGSQPMSPGLLVGRGQSGTGLRTPVEGVSQESANFISFI